MHYVIFSLGRLMPLDCIHFLNSLLCLQTMQGDLHIVCTLQRCLFSSSVSASSFVSSHTVRQLDCSLSTQVSVQSHVGKSAVNSPATCQVSSQRRCNLPSAFTTCANPLPALQELHSKLCQKTRAVTVKLFKVLIGGMEAPHARDFLFFVC